MKELIEKLELLKDKLINSEDLEFVGQFEVVHEAIQSLTQEPSAVSAEEVLNKFVGIYVDDNVDKVYLKSDVLKAMQEYAKTSKREHAIGFAEWISKNGFYKNASETNLLWATNDNANYWGCLYTNEELYTDYLKTLTIKE